MSRLSIQLMALFAVVGIGLLYLSIGISDVSNETKLLWASALSLGLAFTFLIIWTLVRDAAKQRETFKKISP
jgi:hypothetical protein